MTIAALGAAASLSHISSPKEPDKAKGTASVDLSIERKRQADPLQAVPSPFGLGNSPASASTTGFDGKGTTAFKADNGGSGGSGGSLADLLDEMRKRAQADPAEDKDKEEKTNPLDQEKKDKEDVKPPKDSNKILISNPNRINEDGSVNLEEPRFLVFMRDENEQLVFVGVEK